MKIISEVTQPDGSAWSAVVEVRGVAFVANYVANRLTCSLAPYRHAPRRPRWYLESVQRWAEKQVAALPADWMQMHRDLYSA